jgi:hypothetical protein
MRPIVLACSVLIASCGGGDDDSADSHADSHGDVKFECGSTLQCSVLDDYCEVVLGPDMLPVSYHCVPLPVACGNDPKCDCLMEMAGDTTTGGAPQETCSCAMSPEDGLTNSCMPL